MVKRNYRQLSLLSVFNHIEHPQKKAKVKPNTSAGSESRPTNHSINTSTSGSTNTLPARSGSTCLRPAIRARVAARLDAARESPEFHRLWFQLSAIRRIERWCVAHMDKGPLVVIGPPGCGKTMCVEHVLRDQCQLGCVRPIEEYLEHADSWETARLDPVFVQQHMFPLLMCSPMLWEMKGKPVCVLKEPHALIAYHGLDEILRPKCGHSTRRQVARFPILMAATPFTTHTMSRLRRFNAVFVSLPAAPMEAVTQCIRAALCGEGGVGIPDNKLNAHIRALEPTLAASHGNIRHALTQAQLELPAALVSPPRTKTKTSGHPPRDRQFSTEGQINQLGQRVLRVDPCALRDKDAQALCEQWWSANPGRHTHTMMQNIACAKDDTFFLDSYDTFAMWDMFETTQRRMLEHEIVDATENVEDGGESTMNVICHKECTQQYGAALVGWGVTAGRRKRLQTKQAVQMYPRVSPKLVSLDAFSKATIRADKKEPKCVKRRQALARLFRMYVSPVHSQACMAHWRSLIVWAVRRDSWQFIADFVSTVATYGAHGPLQTSTMFWDPRSVEEALQALADHICETSFPRLPGEAQRKLSQSLSLAND